MALDKSILLQKQIKDNSEDLHSEFLDMKNWEEEMRRKDQQLLKESGRQQQDTLPPIRSKQKKIEKPTALKTESTSKPSKPKRIKGYDYASWDKFDVEQACEDMDNNEPEKFVKEELFQEELREDHETATKHKEEGNDFVKKQKWDKAISCYNEAIRIFPYDAVFYANRALCHLKMDNLHSAESDCTAAVQLDETYIKAYHRRATARFGLKQYKEAKQDLEKILKLEVSNKEAKSLLLEVNKKLESSKSINISSNEIEDNVPIEKKIGKVLLNDSKKEKAKQDNVTEEDSREAKISKQIDETNHKKEHEKELKIDKEKNEKGKDISVIEQHQKDSRIPNWLPEKDNVAVVEPITIPAHLKSKKPMISIPIEEVQFVLKGSDNLKTEKCIKEPEVKHTHIRNEEMSKDKVSEDIQNIVHNVSVPKTAVQFLMDWKMNKSSEFRYEYLKQLPPNSLPVIFQDSMESNIFSDIINILQTEFMKRKEPVFQILEDLSRVKRFRALIMFINNADKNSLKNLFEYCRSIENKSTEVITKLCNVYEM